MGKLPSMVSLCSSGNGGGRSSYVVELMQGLREIPAETAHLYLRYTTVLAVVSQLAVGLLRVSYSPGRTVRDMSVDTLDLSLVIVK